jgi:hypothetical protein
MSNHISSIYSEEIHNNLRPLYANWEPTQPIALGDYGKLEDDIFIRFGNVTDLGIKFGERKDNRKNQKFFTSKGSTEYNFNAAGSAPVGGTVNVKANLEINFSSDRAVFFNAAECQYSMIDNKVALGDEVMRKYRKGEWKRSWAVVTDIIVAGATTLAVSGGTSSSVVFEATGNVPNINLADASTSLMIKTARNVGYQIVATQGLVPLMALSRIKPRFLWFDDNFRPLLTAFGTDAVLKTMQMSEEVKTEGSEEELIFAQIE